MSRKLGKLSFYSKEKLAAGGCETKEGLKHVRATQLKIGIKTFLPQN